MQPTDRKTAIVSREYHLAAFLLIIGVIFGGLVSLEWLVSAFHSALEGYYGIGADDLRFLDTGPHISLTFVEVLVSLVAVGGIGTFAASEYLRVRSVNIHRRTCSVGNRIPSSLHLDIRKRMHFIVRRSLVFSLLQLGLYLVELEYGRYISGLGFGLGLTGWSDALAFGTIVSLSLIVGMVTAAISTLGLRSLVALRQLVESRRRLIVASIAKFTLRAREVALSLRDRFGPVFLSRPPPVVVYAYDCVLPSARSGANDE